MFDGILTFGEERWKRGDDRFCLISWIPKQRGGGLLGCRSIKTGSLVPVAPVCRQGRIIRYRPNFQGRPDSPRLGREQAFRRDEVVIPVLACFDPPAVMRHLAHIEIEGIGDHFGREDPIIKIRCGLLLLLVQAGHKKPYPYRATYPKRNSDKPIPILAADKPFPIQDIPSCREKTNGPLPAVHPSRTVCYTFPVWLLTFPELSLSLLISDALAGPIGSTAPG